MAKNSLYDNIRYNKESRLNMGYDYKTNGLINKWVSDRLYMVPTIEGFLNKIDLILIHMTDIIKVSQNYFNFTIDKNDNRRNF